MTASSSWRDTDVEQMHHPATLTAPAQGPLTPMKLTPTTTPGQHKQREPSGLFQSDLFLLNTQILQGGIQGYCA